MRIRDGLHDGAITKLVWWWVATAFWLLVAIPALLAAAMSFMMFDAPGATDSPLTIALFISTLVAPLFCLLGAVVPWLFRSKSFGKWLFCIPLIDLAAFTIVFVAIDHYCAGSLVCK